MATVYLGRARGIAGFEREVAVKLTHEHLRHSPGFITSLIDEARFAGRIRHANVVSVLDVGQDGPGVFIVMDYVEGDSLAGVVRTLKRDDARIPWPICLRLLEDVLTGLHAAHEVADASGNPMGLVHRDVSPHNILVGVDGVSRLTDFGIAKASHNVGDTRTGLIKGKLAYMSPEQARAEAVDRRCDIWAAGIVAWELLSGRRIHDGLGDAALLLKVAREAPTPLGHVATDLPTPLANVVDRALRLHAQDRFPTAEAFADALSAAARAAGISPATHREMRSFVLPLVSEQVELRRRRITELDAAGEDADGILEAVDPQSATLDPRSSSDSMTSAPRHGPLPSRPSVPPPSRPSAPPSSRNLAASAAATVTEAPAASAGDQTVWHGPVGSGPMEEQTATYGHGMEVTGQRPSFAGTAPAASGSRPVRTLLLFGVVFVPLLIIAFWLLSSSRSAGPTAESPKPPPMRPAPVRTAAAAPLPTPVPTPTLAAPAAIPVVEPSALPLMPSSEPKPVRKVPVRFPRRPPPPKPKKPELQGNPYPE